MKVFIEQKGGQSRERNLERIPESKPLLLYSPSTPTTLEKEKKEIRFSVVVKEI